MAIDDTFELEFGYNPGNWWYFILYKDEDVQIAFQETLGVPPYHYHKKSLEVFIDEKRNVDVFYPGEAHQRKKGAMDTSIKLPPPTKGDLYADSSVTA
jgi:hypothetical protein